MLLPRGDDFLKGANCVDIDEVGATYYYYGFTRSDKSYVIMRVRADGTEIRYALGGNTYAADWGNRASLTSYKRPDQFLS